MSKKIVFWSPVDPCVDYFFEKNASLHDVAARFPYIFACSNGIDDLVKEKCGNQAVTINMANNMRGKGTAVFSLLKSMDFDVCIRIDVDAIVFDLPRLIRMASSTGPRQLLGWEIKVGRIRGGCHACGVDIVKNIEPLGDGPNFDAAMCERTRKMGGELVHCKLFEMSRSYAGESPVWHPKKDDRTLLFDKHIEMWRVQQAKLTREFLIDSP